MKRSVHEVIDGNVDQSIIDEVSRLAESVEGVVDTEKVRVRKSGIGLFADLHVRVPSHLTVFEGHTISHMVKDRIMEHDKRIYDVLVHLEPAGCPPYKHC